MQASAYPWAWKTVGIALLVNVLGFALIYVATPEFEGGMNVFTGLSLVILVIGQLLFAVSFGLFANDYAERKTGLSLLMMILLAVMFLVVATIGIGILLMFLSYIGIRWFLRRKSRGTF